MNNQPDAIQRFLVAAIAQFLRVFLTPLYYVMRTDMGIQHSALIPVFISGGMHSVFWAYAARISDVNRRAISVYVTLAVLGYLRNMLQAVRRRKRRDWTVHSWSTGESLLAPVLLFICRGACRRWKTNARVVTLSRMVLAPDFIYYFVEPATLLVASAALFSIGTTLYLDPILLALALIVVRNDAQLWRYLKAHEIADGKMLEGAIKSEFEAPAPTGRAGIRVAQIPAASSNQKVTDGKRVFDRLSPELQLLLIRDRAARHE